MLQNRLVIPDARGTGAYLRVTRHPDQGKVVLSHWRDGVCVASTPVELVEVPALIGVLADALGDGLSATERVAGRRRSLRWSRWWRSGRAVWRARWSSAITRITHRPLRRISPPVSGNR